MTFLYFSDFFKKEKKKEKNAAKRGRKTRKSLSHACACKFSSPLALARRQSITQQPKPPLLGLKGRECLSRGLFPESSASPEARATRPRVPAVSRACANSPAIRWRKSERERVCTFLSSSTLWLLPVPSPPRHIMGRRSHRSRRRQLISTGPPAAGRPCNDTRVRGHTFSPSL